MELESLCKKYFQRDKKKYINILVNEAILYEDIEKYDVARDKFVQAEEMCDESLESDVYIFVIDELSRLLQKTGAYYYALEKLYLVEECYRSKQDTKGLQNVRNRIGLNLCYIGDVQEATSYLEQLYLSEFNGKFYGDNTLSCEVAN